MSVNHYHNTLSLQHLNDVAVAQRESLFEKSLTPSDVGKLNRLVIPKQHAEKYFPLNNGGGGDDMATTEKGMLLSFEDESGKCWKFRYSYWNSSQSYVLTKGWSRYVKDKHLDAGDVVFFQRHRFDLHRLFIGWRRRGEASSSPAVSVVSQEALVNTTAYWSGLTTPYRQVHASTTYPNIHHEYSHYGKFKLFYFLFCFFFPFLSICQIYTPFCFFCYIYIYNVYIFFFFKKRRLVVFNAYGSFKYIDYNLFMLV